MLEQIEREVWEKPSQTIKKLLQVVSDSYSECGENEGNFKRVSALQAEIEKATARKQALEMKWLDGNLSDDDRDRLCSVLDNNISTYQAEIDSINSLLEQLPDVEDIVDALDYELRITKKMPYKHVRGADISSSFCTNTCLVH